MVFGHLSCWRCGESQPGGEVRMEPEQGGRRLGAWERCQDPPSSPHSQYLPEEEAGKWVASEREVGVKAGSFLRHGRNYSKFVWWSEGGNIDRREHPRGRRSLMA